jgi:glycerol-3-phosphate responsive antiterminator
LNSPHPQNKILIDEILITKNMAHKVSNYRDLIVRIILIDKSFLPKISEYIPTSNLDVVNTIKNIMPGK